MNPKSPPHAPSRLRLFVAVEAADHVLDVLAKTQGELRDILPRGLVRWVRREHIHLTLKFLGDIEEAWIGALSEKLLAACASFPPLHLRAEGVGAFPNLRAARVLWAGVFDDSGQLLDLREAIEAACSAAGIPRDTKPFSPHITLGRISHMSVREARTLASAAEPMAERAFGEWNASQVELIRSDLMPGQPPVHTTIAVFETRAK